MEGLEKLGIAWPSLLAQVVNFLILLTLLYLVAYKPILRMLDNRSQRIKESMDQAKETQERYAQAEVEVRAQLDQSRQEGQALINQASQMGERVREEARQEARQEAETLVNRARDEIARERETAIDELRSEFADLAISAAEKVINRSLDKEAHRKLIEEVLEESTSPKGEG
ncbi:MAG: F0F1 ATP synthase subunit B [Dehalococcoidia bacterium]